MPVISKNALVSVFDSYSCVGIVSDSTLTSSQRSGYAAFMNHSISFICSSFDSTEGWNSVSIQRLAASVVGAAVAAGCAPGAAAVGASSFLPQLINNITVAASATAVRT